MSPASQETIKLLLYYINRLQTEYKQAQLELSDDRAEHWDREVERIRERQNSPTLIAVCGAMGSGKSTLLNAILKNIVVPTCGLNACTSVVTKISYHEEPTIIGQIQFLSEAEWAEDVQKCQDELKDNQVSSMGDRPSLAAWDKIHAVYPNISRKDFCKMTLDSLLRIQFLSCLGTMQTIISTTSEEFSTALTPYIDNVGTATSLGEAPLVPNSVVWPLVREVHIFCNAECLASGATLVDLPGVGDANAARSAVAKRYLQKCDRVWVVAPIIRAIDDQSAKDLLGEAFKSQLIMDGKLSYQSNQLITFIATKNDEISASEIIKKLGLKNDPELIKLENEIKEFQRKEKLENGIIASLRRSCSAKEKELEDFSLAARKRKQLNYSGNETVSVKKVKLSNGPTDNTAPPSEIAQNEASEFVVDLKNRIAETEQSSIVLNARLLNFQGFKNVLCAKKRAEYAKMMIKTSIQADLTEIDAENDSADNMCEHGAMDVSVFACSAMDYIRINNLTSDGAPLCFMSPDDTEIPQLQAWVHTVTQGSQKRQVELMITETRVFVQTVKAYCQDSVGGLTQAQKAALKQRWSTELGNEGIQSRLWDALNSVIQARIFAFKELAESQLNEVLSCAAETAASTVLEVYENAISRLHGNTYRAVIRHDGNFNTAKGIDLNDVLSSKLKKIIARPWGTFFQKQHFIGSLESHVVDAIEKIVLTISESEVTAASQVPLKNQAKEAIEEARVSIRRTISTVHDIVRKKQRDLTWSLAPEIQNMLKEVYQHASLVKGDGCTARQKTIMHDFIDAERERIFAALAELLIDGIANIATAVDVCLTDDCCNLARKVELNLAALWKPDQFIPENIRKALTNLERTAIETLEIIRELTA